MTPAEPTPAPILYARAADAEGMRVGMLVFRPEEAPAPEIEVEGGTASPPQRACVRAGLAGWLAELTLPARSDARYIVDGTAHPVAADLTGDMRIGFVSCNGREHGDGSRDLKSRNAMWNRLAGEHGDHPLSLMLQGGDQIYADEILTSHAEIRRWHRFDHERKGEIEWTAEMRDAAEDWLFRRYLTLLSDTGVATLHAQVPSLMMWDDHDIIDGWGSHPETLQSSPVGRGIFDTAAAMFRLFQQGRSPDGPVERSGTAASFAFPGAHALAPDLRSSRTKDRVMDETAWQDFEERLAALPEGEPLILISTVPLLGPRLSIVERLMNRFPGIQKYEDDLRDQWQSHAHREEWCRMLRAMEREMEGGRPIVVVSGEIHLATRGEMRLPSGKVLHQLVASGIAHPEPPLAYALGLGALAGLGEDPLAGRPISIHPLPGRKRRYVNERNWLLLERRNGAWTAAWETETSGRTQPLSILT